MAGNLVKSVMLKIVADDGDSEAKLDAISAKAKELGAQHPDLQVKVDSAAASAKLAVLRTELKATANDVDGDGSSLGSRLRGLGGAASSLTGLGDAFGVMNPEASMFQKVMSGASLATGLLEPVAAGAIVAVGGMAAGLVAAGAGLGVFGLVAKSAVTQVEAANKAGTKLTGGMGDLQRSMASATKDWDGFVNSNASGVAKIMSQGIGLLPKILPTLQPLLNSTEKALSGLVTQLGKGLDSSGFKSFMADLSANAGPAITKLGTAIGHIVVGIGGVIKAFMPMAQDVLSGIDKITSKFATWGSTLSQHSGFQSLMNTFKTETPMAMKTLENLGTAILNIGKAMTGLSTGSNSKALLQILTPLSGVIASLSKNTDLDRIALYLLAASDAGKKLGKTFDGLFGKDGAVSQIKGVVTGLGQFKSGFTDADQAASEATGAWGTFGGKVSGLGGMLTTVATKMRLLRTATVEGTEAQEGMDVAMEANPIGLVVVAVAALAAGFVLAYTHIKVFRDAVNDVGRAIKTGFLDAVNGVKIAVVDVINFIKAHWMLIAGIMLGPVALAVALVLTYWKQIKTGALDAWNFVKSTVTSALSAVGNAIKTAFAAIGSVVTAGWNLVKSATSTVWGWLKDFVNTEVNGVKTILSWFGNLGSLFEGWWNKGYSAVKSVAGDLLSFVKGIPGNILSALGDLGSLLFNAGKNIIQGLINGIKSMVGDVSGAVSSIVSDIRNFLPFSPAKKGPLSGSGSPRIAGVKIGEMLAEGLTSSASTVSASASKVAGAATMAATGGAAGAAARANGQQVQLSFQGGGSQSLTAALVLALRKEIRVQGGNVQTVLGH